MFQNLFYCASLGVLLVLGACAPKAAIEFRQVQNIALKAGDQPVLTGEAVFYNPNKAHGKIKKLKIAIFVNDKPAGSIEEDPDLSIKGQSEFTIPITVLLTMDKPGLVDTIMGVIGAKKIKVHFLGNMRVSYSGIPFRVPVDYTREVGLQL